MNQSSNKRDSHNVLLIDTIAYFDKNQKTLASAW